MKYLNNGEIIGHSGSDPGVFSLVLFNPSKETGLIIFMNQDVKLNVRTINLCLMIKGLVKEVDL